MDNLLTGTRDNIRDLLTHVRYLSVDSFVAQI